MWAGPVTPHLRRLSRLNAACANVPALALSLRVSCSPRLLLDPQVLLHVDLVDEVSHERDGWCQALGPMPPLAREDHRLALLHDHAVCARPARLRESLEVGGCRIKQRRSALALVVLVVVEELGVIGRVANELLAPANLRQPYVRRVGVVVKPGDGARRAHEHLRQADVEVLRRAFASGDRVSHAVQSVRDIVQQVLVLPEWSPAVAIEHAIVRRLQRAKPVRLAEDVAHVLAHGQLRGLDLPPVAMLEERRQVAHDHLLI
eukprot:CAMPEP_0176308610 /NCGR_PEP_ID=MMETSP0121_2-20121125/64636_1 /TAXON_ID=160619 /ORGANISM="Kryptoperidinium foliaceum, Strain CCMP 1326" /LENGTH=260 /DNA_ID=CAMNT_0017650455 /DNA_START=27 /DNA_END=806 /DNA_ORIENTATION=+